MWKKGKVIKGLWVIMIVIGLCSYFVYKKGINAKDIAIAVHSRLASNIETETLAEFQVESYKGVIGTMDSFDFISRVNGKVYGLYVKSGDAVKRGDPLMLIDNREEAKKLKKAWDEAIGNIEPVKEKTLAAAEELKRITPLYNKGEMPPEDYKTQAEALNRCTEELSEIIKNSDMAKIKYDIAVENSYITAPADGVITDLHLEKKEDISSGTRLCGITETEIKYIEFTVKEDLFPDIFLGEPVTVTADEVDHKGSITEIDRTVDASGHYRVRAIIYDPRELSDDQRAEVRFGYNETTEGTDEVPQDIVKLNEAESLSVAG